MEIEGNKEFGMTTKLALNFVACAFINTLQWIFKYSKTFDILIMII